MTRVLEVTLVIFSTLLLAAWAGTKFMDGPIGPIPGGELRTGKLDDSVDPDWVERMNGSAMGEVELQLENPVGSRTTAAFVYDGDLYVPCDLGFVWRRVPKASLRTMLRVIWSFKDWHENAMADGRVVVRIDGRRYERHAVRVTDPALLSVFREQMANGAAGAFGALLPIETNPDDIWFFRLDPRQKQDTAEIESDIAS
jgi:hypothetical protein